MALPGADRVVAGIFGVLTARTGQYQRRDAVLAVQTPVLLLVQLVTWLGIFAVGFTLALVPSTPTLAHAAREALSSTLTLGFTSTHGIWATLVDSAAALSGLVVIA